MNALDSSKSYHESAEACPPAVATLIAGAVATFDADRTACRRYLLRASAILKASTARDNGSAPDGRSRSGLAQWQLNKVVDYVERNLTGKIMAQDMAALAGISVGQFFRAFKISVGATPLQYVASRRLELARTLLRTTSEELSQIAVLCGYCDQSHLCRVFRRALGVTPAAWRRMHAPAPPPSSPGIGALSPRLEAKKERFLTI